MTGSKSASVNILTNIMSGPVTARQRAMLELKRVDWRRPATIYLSIITTSVVFHQFSKEILNIVISQKPGIGMT